MLSPWLVGETLLAGTNATKTSRNGRLRRAGNRKLNRVSQFSIGERKKAGQSDRNKYCNNSSVRYAVLALACLGKGVEPVNL